MSLFSEALPEWDNVGVEPSGAKKTAGWQLDEKPPAEWFNWLFNRGYKCIEELQTVVDAIAISSGAANVVVPGTSSAGSDGYTITPAAPIAAYASGMVVALTVDVANTGAATLNVSAKGAKNIKKIASTGKVDLVTGDIIAGGTYTLVYDGTDFVLTSPLGVDAGLFTAAGDTLYASAAGVPARLAKGTDTQVLQLTSGLPSWVNKMTLTKGNGNDFSTSYNANETKTVTIPLGQSAKIVRLSLGNGSNGYSRLITCDSAQEITLLSPGIISGNYMTLIGSFQFSYTSNPADSFGIFIQSARISGTNLILTFQCGNSSTRTINAVWFWEAIG